MRRRNSARRLSSRRCARRWRTCARRRHSRRARQRPRRSLLRWRARQRSRQRPLAQAEYRQDAAACRRAGPAGQKVAAREIEKAAEAPHSEERSSPSGDYYSLFQPTTAPALQPAEEETEAAGAGIDYRRHAKWALPVAACLLLVTNTGTAISTVSRFVTTGEKPALIVQPVNPEPFIEVVEQRVGIVEGRIDA